MSDLDSFLAECDDVISDWHSSEDAASWAAGGAYEPPSRHGETRFIRFTPLRTDDLRSPASEWISRSFEVTYAWTVTEEDGGSYVGQAVWMPTDRNIPLGWIPDCDLTDE